MIADYQTDHLFILVGENPLPCLVAGRLLLKAGGTIHLVYMTPKQDENKYAVGLMNVLDARKKDAVQLNHERNAASVFAETHVKAMGIPANNTVGLHYTGGTKVMAVHAHRAVLAARTDAICSYLDPNRLELCIERKGESVATVKLLAADMSEQIRLVLSELWLIHGLTPMQLGDKEYSERTTPALREAPRLLCLHVAQGRWQAWLDALKGDAKKGVLPTLTDEDAIAALPFPDVAAAISAERPELNTIGDLRRYLGSRAENWLTGGDWLEDAVLGALQAVQKRLHLTPEQLSCSVIMKRPTDGGKYFEVDVIALRGYQLFVFSCTVSSNPETCKLKLFEVARRAAQLGGSEARYALVCCHDNKNTLTNQIGDTLSPNTFTVFDRHDLNDLKRALTAWIPNVDKDKEAS